MLWNTTVHHGNKGGGKEKKKVKQHRNWNVWKEVKTTANMFMKVFGGSKLMHVKNCLYSSCNLKIE